MHPENHMFTSSLPGAGWINTTVTMNHHTRWYSPLFTRMFSTMFAHSIFFCTKIFWRKTGPFQYPLKWSENKNFSDAFKGYWKRQVTWNGFPCTMTLIRVFWGSYKAFKWTAIIILTSPKWFLACGRFW